MLAEAVCKLMSFTYAPSESLYWMHGHSSETDSIYVTTQSLTHEQLAAISDEVGENSSLLVCCKAFRANPDAFPNLTIKKIPQAVLRKCEWGKDDYSLKVENLPDVGTGSRGPASKAREDFQLFSPTSLRRKFKPWQTVKSAPSFSAFRFDIRRRPPLRF